MWHSTGPNEVQDQPPRATKRVRAKGRPNVLSRKGGRLRAFGYIASLGLGITSDGDGEWE